MWGGVGRGRGVPGVGGGEPRQAVSPLKVLSLLIMLRRNERQGLGTVFCLIIGSVTLRFYP